MKHTYKYLVYNNNKYIGEFKSIENIHNKLGISKKTIANIINEKYTAYENQYIINKICN